MVNSNAAIISHKPIRVLLADDDHDDRYFFERTIKTIPISSELAMVNNGEELMIYLNENAGRLPDVLFLDLNMPKKNGSECLLEIKQNPKLKDLPVIIYSTSLDKTVTDLLYTNGAHFYVRKMDIDGLKKVLNHILLLLSENRFPRPIQRKFILSMTDKTYH